MVIVLTNAASRIMIIDTDRLPARANARGGGVFGFEWRQAAVGEAFDFHLEFKLRLSVFRIGKREIFDCLLEIYRL